MNTKEIVIVGIIAIAIAASLFISGLFSVSGNSNSASPEIFVTPVSLAKPSAAAIWLPSSIKGSFYATMYQWGGLSPASEGYSPACGSGAAGTWTESVVYNVTLNGRTIYSISSATPSSSNYTQISQITAEAGRELSAAALESAYSDGFWYTLNFTPDQPGQYWMGLQAIGTNIDCQENNFQWSGVTSTVIANVTSPFLAGTISAATTAPATTTALPVSLPPNFLADFWQSLGSFFSNILGILGLHTFSIAGGQNFSVDQPFTASVTGLMIPAQWQTRNTTTAQSKLVRQTFCAPFVVNSQSQVLYDPQPTLVQGGEYNATFTYSPSSRQVLIYGAICRSDNITYSYLSGQWGQWSPFVTVANESGIAHAGMIAVQPNPISQFFSGIAQFFAGLWAALTGA
jgi:hypothetical protein